MAGALGYAGYRLVTWPGFRLERLIVNGAHVTPRAEIVRRAAIDPRANVWLVDFGAVRARVEALPYVRTARLRHVLPATIAIDVLERRPNGCLEGAGGARALIDADRRVLASACARSIATFRVPNVAVPQPGAFVRDDGLARLQQDAGVLQAAGVAYETLQHDRYGDLDASLSGGALVRFGDDADLEAKARLVAPILRTVGTARRIRGLDLRAPGAPVVRFQQPAEPRGTPAVSPSP